NFGPQNWNVINTTILPPEPDKPNSNIAWLQYAGEAANSARFNDSRIFVQEPSSYMVSFDFFCPDINAWDGSNAFVVRRFSAASGGTSLGTTYLTKSDMVIQGLVSNQWKRFSFIFNALDAGEWLAVGPYISGTFFDCSYREIKVEKGTKATDWSPAPEDVQAAIDTAHQAAIDADNARIALANSLKALAYLDAVQVAQLGTSVIQGGYIRTTLLDVAAIKAATVNAQEIIVGGWPGSSVATSVNNAISTAQSNAISTAASDATSRANAAQSAASSAAASDATTKANNARTTAISTAASDATSKANAAEAAAISAAQTYANNVAQSKADI